MSFQNLIRLLILSTIVSCSWIDKQAQSLFGFDENAPTQDGAAKRPPRRAEYVPKDQYDALMTKYKELLDKKQSSSDREVMPNRNMSDQMIKELDDVKSAPKNAPVIQQTVDIFADDKKVAPRIETNVAASAPVISRELDYQTASRLVQKYQEGVELVGKGQTDQALKIFQELERSPMEQIRVRAKYQIAEMLFAQKEYDMAMQVYEDILQTHAFSGVVIKALKKLVICSKELNLNDKANTYNSFLVDIFGVS